MRVLVVNAGSSTLKLRLLDDDDETVGDRELSWDDVGEGLPGRIATEIEGLGLPDAVGHRVVHGGHHFTGPVRVTDDVVRRVEQLAPLAPLHQERNLAGIRILGDALGDVPAVACFDTTHHLGLPDAAATYALPRRWRRRFGLRRFGFHGLSHAWAASRAAELTGRSGDETLRVLSCHLGSGASLCASRGGRSVDTTMGFTPLEGLVMATRSGTVDPGLVLWLIEHGGLSVGEVAGALRSESGLAGLTGGEGDMREILEERATGDSDAATAYAVYVHRLVREAAAMAASLEGLDAVVFTGGVGENSPEVRGDVATRLGFLGVAVDDASNCAHDGGDTDLTAADADVATLVIEAREDLEIAAGVRDVLAPTPSA